MSSVDCDNEMARPPIVLKHAADIAELIDVEHLDTIGYVINHIPVPTRTGFVSFNTISLIYFLYFRKTFKLDISIKNIKT
jgi:hypothetical protein